MLKELLKSKKFVVAVLGTVVGIANSVFNLGLDVQELMAALSPLIAYIIGQGISDSGKERAKVQFDTIFKNGYRLKVPDETQPDYNIPA